MKTPTQSSNLNDKQDTLIAIHTAGMSLIEIAFGSLLHTLHIPMTGQILNLIQIGFMTSIVRESRDINSPLYLSCSTAVLKSLSPAGKKLTPMIAITCQGYLYTFGLYLLYPFKNLRIHLASALSSLWPIIQPLTVYYFLYDGDLFKIFNFYKVKIENTLSISLLSFQEILFIIVILKLFLSQVILIPFYFNKHQKIINSLINHNKNFKNPSKKTFLNRSVKKFLFLFFTIFLTFMFYNTNQDDKALVVWKSIRPIGIIILFNILLIIVPFRYLMRFIPKRSRVFKIVEQSFDIIKDSSDK